MTTPTPDERGAAPGDPGPPPQVRARLDVVPALAGRGWRIETLPGGLTNQNYRLTSTDDPRRSVVARLAGETGSLLAIDRRAEYECSVAAATTGVAPGVVDYAPSAGVLVIEWVSGRTLTEADLRAGERLEAVVSALRRLHAGPRFPIDFDMFDIQRRYLDVVQRNGFRLPDRYLEFMPVVERIASALAVRATATVPCHNDLLAANLIDDGERIWVIDYEYAGNNDPCFELGNLWSESDLAPDQLDRLIALYYGEPLRHKVSRARLLGLVSKYGWTLWAAIQDGASAMDFDFWSWGMEKYDRAVAEFDGPDLEYWIEEVQRPD